MKCSITIVLLAYVALVQSACASGASADDTRESTIERACLSSSANQRSVRLRISHDLATYAALHILKSCIKAYEATADGAPLAPSRAGLLDVAKQTAGVLEPLYRAHPSLRGKSVRDGVYKAVARTAPKGRPAKLSRRSADWLKATTAKLSGAITQSVKEQLDQASDKEAALAAANAASDIVAEFGFASGIVYDAYPALWTRGLRDAMAIAQPRTAETDAAYRKGAPRPGSVQLSAGAKTLVKNLYQQLDRLSPSVPQLVSISWIEESRGKGPTDTNWMAFARGLQLGASPKQHFPPDVVDRIDGLEVVISVPDPRAIEGKTIDLRDHRLFIREK